jgi:hypothetical protein
MKADHRAITRRDFINATAAGVAVSAVSFPAAAKNLEKALG